MNIGKRHIVSDSEMSKKLAEIIYNTVKEMNYNPNYCSSKKIKFLLNFIFNLGDGF